MARFESRDHYERRVKQLFQWSTEEDIQLKKLLKEGKVLKDIGDILDRSMFAIVARTRYISGFENSSVKGSKPKNLYDENYSLQEVYTERMQRWSNLDNEKLKMLYSQGENIYNLAYEFNRTPRGVLMHLQDLYESPKELAVLFEYAKQFVGRKRIINSSVKEANPESISKEVISVDSQ